MLPQILAGLAAMIHPRPRHHPEHARQET
jgi:hypothetical protein